MIHLLLSLAPSISWKIPPSLFTCHLAKPLTEDSKGAGESGATKQRKLRNSKSPLEGCRIFETPFCEGSTWRAAQTHSDSIWPSFLCEETEWETFIKFRHWDFWVITYPNASLLLLSSVSTDPNEVAEITRLKIMKFVFLFLKKKTRSTIVTEIYV